MGAHGSNLFLFGEAGAAGRPDPIGLGGQLYWALSRGASGGRRGAAPSRARGSSGTSAAPEARACMNIDAMRAMFRVKPMWRVAGPPGLPFLTKMRATGTAVLSDPRPRRQVRSGFQSDHASGVRAPSQASNRSTSTRNGPKLMPHELPAKLADFCLRSHVSRENPARTLRQIRPCVQNARRDACHTLMCQPAGLHMRIALYTT